MRSAESDCDMRMIWLHRCERAAEHSQDVLQWRKSVSWQLKGTLFLMQSRKVPVYIVWHQLYFRNNYWSGISLGMITQIEEVFEQFWIRVLECWIQVLEKDRGGDFFLSRSGFVLQIMPENYWNMVMKCCACIRAIKSMTVSRFDCLNSEFKLNSICEVVEVLHEQFHSDLPTFQGDGMVAIDRRVVWTLFAGRCCELGYTSTFCTTFL